MHKKRLEIFLLFSLFFLFLFITLLIRQSASVSAKTNRNSHLQTEYTEQTETIQAQKKTEDSMEASTDAVDRITVTVTQDPSESRAFTWYSTKGNRDNYNELQVVAEDEEGLFFSDGINYQAADLVSSDEGIYLHKVVANQLEPDTQYFFRIGDATLNRWSKVGSFTTSGASEYAFLAVSDTQASDDIGGYQFTADGLAMSLSENSDAAFMVNTGDFVNSGEYEDDWKNVLDLCSNTFMNITLVPVAGNHESQENTFMNHFNLPILDTTMTNGTYYSFDAGYAHYVILNTNVESDEIKCIGQTQYEWMKNDILAAKTKGAIWIIVLMHKGPYTVAMHSLDDEITASNGLRNQVADTLEDLGVDLVIQGHDHYPSCTGILKNGQRSNEGTVFLEEGTIGPNAHEFNSSLSEDYLNLFDYIASNVRNDQTYQNYARIEVSKNSLNIEMRERDVTQGLDHSTLIYQKVITK